MGISWKFFVRAAVPFVRMAAEQFKNQDADSVGKDDLIGVALSFAADILDWALSDNPGPAPKAPSALK